MDFRIQKEEYLDGDIVFDCKLLTRVVVYLTTGDACVAAVDFPRLNLVVIVIEICC